MKRIFALGFVLPVVASAVLVAAFQGACNNVGDCPAALFVTPGGTCTSDNLQCPYTLQTDSPACDGTTVDGGIATSCICTKGTWVCPSPVSCGGQGGVTDDGGAESGDDGSGADDGGDAGPG
jgi:hypothetical protein